MKSGPQQPKILSSDSLGRNPAHSDAVLSSAIGRDGLIATGSQDHTVRLWSAQGDLLATLPASTAYVTIAAFSKDGSRLATVGSNGPVRLWDVARLAEVRQLQADLLNVKNTAKPAEQNMLQPPGDIEKLFDRLYRLVDRTPPNYARAN
jgi:WD40 repeat protein